MGKTTSSTLASGKYVSLRSKPLADGRQSLYLHIYQSGKRKKYFLHLYLTKNRELDKETLRYAKALRAQKENDILSMENEFVPEFKKHGDFVAYFKALAEASGDKAWLNTSKHLEKFTDKKPVSFKAVTAQWLEQLKTYLLKQVSQNSAATYYHKIKAALNKAIKEKIIKVNPAQEVENIRNEETIREYLTFEEVQKLASTACPDEEVKRAFLFAVFTGLRISDVIKLTWKEVQGDQLEFKQKKTKAANYIPLSEQALSYLGENGLPTSKVFALPSEELTRRIIKKWVKAAEITKNISFHSARHTYATLALTYGIDIYTVKDLLGHTNIRNTQIYAKIIDEKKRAAVKLLPVIGKKEQGTQY